MMADEQKRILTDMILKLNRTLLRVNDLEDFQEHVGEFFGEVLSFDWFCVFLAGNYDSPPALITRRTPPISWDEIHQIISVEDLHSSVLFKSLPGEIFLSQNMKGPGCEGDEHVLGTIGMKGGFRFSAHMVLAVNRGFRLFISMFRRSRLFSQNETDILKLLKPTLCMCAQSLLSTRILNSEGILLSGLNNNPDYRYLLLDQNLEVISMPEPTRKFFVEHFNDSSQGTIPSQLRKWLGECIDNGRKYRQNEVDNTILDSNAGRIKCMLCAFNDSSGSLGFLVVLENERENNDFTHLGGFGLTKQEVCILAHLYAGNKNAQIAKHLNIKDITVRKHLQSIGRKLHASGRTEILAKAIEARDETPAYKVSFSAPKNLPYSHRIPVGLLNHNAGMDTVIDLNRQINSLRSFDEFPILIKSIISEQMPFDWAAVYCITSSNEAEKISVTPGLGINFTKWYPEIRNLLSWCLPIRNGMVGEIFLTQDLINQENEQDLFTKTIMVAATGAYYSINIPIAKTSDHSVYMGLYRNNHECPFSKEDVAFMENISPIIVSWAQSIVRLMESTVSFTGNHVIFEQKNIQAVLFNRDLCETMWTAGALELLVSKMGPSWRKQMLPTLRGWIRQLCKEQVGEKASVQWTESLTFDEYNLECCAYPLGSHILVKFKQRIPEPFIILKKSGLTEREIQTLSYLQLGYTNRQIASALGIREVTVKKHLRNIGEKLDAKGRITILRKAEEFKRLLKT